MIENIIEIKNLKFKYNVVNPLFDDISLTIKEGETIGLIGSNGAGKSTLLKLLVGLHSIEGGMIKVDGIELQNKNIQEIRKKIGFAFQDTDSQLFMTTVYEDVAFGPRNQGRSKDEVEELVFSSLRQVGGEHLINRPPYKLSGGEKRLVTLATVLSMEPKVIVLDEPTTGLDPKARRKLIQLLKLLPQTQIIATHDMDMALEICHRVFVMHEGKVVMEGNPKMVFKDSKLLDECHLELPIAMQGCEKCGTKY